ncbi:hypothetical protein NX722_17310 [Endozoicomonas gorgoniicola]|uniref:Uncharacterized protein n=1 Tax=Endozoicomonas gorgoniicola TaxID=1234144 RepID=A0ABT3MY86_9GAMM|nr:hypothetical protein [Endozoicomonas gorgoniicola]MCW7554346.1 hypothetical protein [Endozoicomonas gorgoniicola]
MEGSRNIPPGPTPSGKALTEETVPGEEQPDAGSTAPPDGRPKMEGLEPGKAPKKSLRQRMARAQPEATPTTGQAKKNSPEALLRERENVLTDVNQLSVINGKLKILGEAQRALESPNAPPDGLTIKVEIDNRMVSIIPPDTEALRGQDMEQLLREVKEAVNRGYAKCATEVGPKPLPEQFQELQQKFIQLSRKLGKEYAEGEVIQGHLNQALKAVPKSMQVDYSGGTVLIERVIKPKKKPAVTAPEQPPQSSEPARPENDSPGD